MHSKSSKPHHLAPRWSRAGTLLLAAALPLSAVAQETPPPAGEKPKTEEIIHMETYSVTSGFRGSLAAAAELKQATPAIAEMLAAEDIGKLPDISIADSLSRLSGLATQRLNGRSQAISIRGLTGDFTTGLLNGREQVSTGSNRAVEFDQYPAELLSGAVVYKTTDAALVGQGMAGTIDLRTVRPLSQGKRTIAVNSFYDRTQFGALNAGSKNSGVRYSASYIDQFGDGKFGVAIGFAHADLPGQGEQWNAWGYPNVEASVSPTKPYVIGGAKPFVRSSELKRNGLMAVLEYKPSANFHSTVDIYRSKFNETQLLRGIEIPLQWSSATLQPGFTVDNELIINPTFNNVYGVIRNDVVDRNNDVWAAGWNMQFGDRTGWKTTADISYSRIYRKDRVLETYSGAGSVNAIGFGSSDTMAVTMGSGRGAIFTPTLDYADPSKLRLTSPQGWGSDVVPGGQVGYLKNPTAKDSLSQAKLFTEYDLKGWFSRVEFGAAYSRRTKSEIEDGYYLALANGQTSAPLPTSNGVTNLSFIGISGMASYDPLAALNSGIYDQRINPNADVITGDWKVAEKVALAYAKCDLDGKLGSMPLTGNFGAQLIRTDQSSTGLSTIPISGKSVLVPTTGGTKYWNVLPSLNLSLEVAERRYIRLGVSEQLARQRMSDMRAGLNAGFNPALATSTDPLKSAWSASGGNPALKPWRADALDLSFEHYFKNKMGYYAINGFVKKLKTYTYNQKQIADFTGFPSGGVTPATYLGTVDRPVNGDGGSIKGVEATISLPSELFTSNLPGFGIVLNGAYTKSSIQPNGPTSTPIAIPGLSARVASATVYFERAGFSCRVSERYRSEYRGNIDTFGPRGNNYQVIAAEAVTDAQMSYEFRKGALKGLTVIVQAYNLTNEPLKTTSALDPRLITNYQEYGASYSAGVSYKF